MVLKLSHCFVSILICYCVIAQTNYSNLNNWACHPLLKDYGDSVPKPLRQSFTADTSVDIFFIHPTTYLDKNKPFGQYADITNEQLNNTTDKTAILYQATIFNAAGRLFAPRYRQAHISSYFPVTTSDTNYALQAFDTAYADIKNAFQYYLLHFNNGKPIVIASHSQGTTHAKKLIKEFFDGTSLQNKLVVAYLVGMPVEANWFTSIKPCITPTQTNCFCSWRTFKKGYKPDYTLKEKDEVVVTNPISWNSEKPNVSRFENKGTMLRNFNKILNNVVDANVAGNVLWTSKPRFFGNIFLTTKNYHIADYNFYYMSIRENVALRIKNYPNLVTR